jgi:hypothetical protein
MSVGIGLRMPGDCFVFVDYVSNTSFCFQKNGTKFMDSIQHILQETKTNGIFCNGSLYLDTQVIVICGIN